MTPTLSRAPPCPSIPYMKPSTHLGSSPREAHQLHDIPRVGPVGGETRGVAVLCPSRGTKVRDLDSANKDKQLNVKQGQTANCFEQGKKWRHAAEEHTRGGRDGRTVTLGGNGKKNNTNGIAVFEYERLASNNCDVTPDLSASLRAGTAAPGTSPVKTLSQFVLSSTSRLLTLALHSPSRRMFGDLRSPWTAFLLCKKATPAQTSPMSCRVSDSGSRSSAYLRKERRSPPVSSSIISTSRSLAVVITP